MGLRLLDWKKSFWKNCDLMNKIKNELGIISLLILVLQFGCGTKADQPVFLFDHHFINDDLPTIEHTGVQSLADYTGNGYLDMTVGSKDHGLYLLANKSTEWTTTRIGDVPFTSLGATSLDVDGDGWPDLVSAGVWYRNEGNGTFSMHVYDTTIRADQEVHDLMAIDVNNDAKPDIVVAGDRFGFYWYNTDPVPGNIWERVTIDPDHTSYVPKIHGGFSPGGVGDLDGDGDNDIFMAVAWFENRDNGKIWIKHPLEYPELFSGKLPWGKSTRSIIIDIDGDGDNDIVFTTCDDIDAKIGIIENVKGDGSEWRLKLLPQTAEGRRCSLHSLAVADFNQDGYIDIITVDQEDMMKADTALHSPRWFIYTNVGNGWEEQVLFDIGIGGHDIIVGDVDGDGDLDIVSKVWKPWKKSSNKGRSHALFIKNISIP
jgi:hypothetical protein